MTRNLGGVLLTLVTGCSLISGPEDERVMSTIGYPDAVIIAAPDSVSAGQGFEVSVRTYAPDGCWRKDGTEVLVVGRSVSITPYDIRNRDRAASCLQLPQDFTHTATLSLGEPGVVQLNVRGRDGTAVRSIVVR